MINFVISNTSHLNSACDSFLEVIGGRCRILVNFMNGSTRNVQSLNSFKKNPIHLYRSRSS